MVHRSRRAALLAAVLAPFGVSRMAQAASAPGPSADGAADAVRQLARDWFESLAAGQLHPATHPDIVLSLHGLGAGLDGVPERFEGRETVAAIAAAIGAARWEVSDLLVDGQRAALRGSARFPDGRAAAFAAFIEQRDGRVVRMDRHVDRVWRQPMA